MIICEVCTCCPPPAVTSTCCNKFFITKGMKSFILSRVHKTLRQKICHRGRNRAEKNRGHSSHRVTGTEMRNRTAMRPKMSCANYQAVWDPPVHPFSINGLLFLFRVAGQCHIFGEIGAQCVSFSWLLRPQSAIQPIWAHLQMAKVSPRPHSRSCSKYNKRFPSYENLSANANTCENSSGLLFLETKPQFIILISNPTKDL